MTDLNKIISLFIGLFVVIFLLALVLGRIDVGFPKVDLGGALGEIFQGDEKAEAKPTPTPKNENVVVVTKAPTSGSVVVVTKPTNKPNPTATPNSGTNTPETEKGGQTATEIPATGASMILPLSAMLASLGIYLRKKNPS